MRFIKLKIHFRLVSPSKQVQSLQTFQQQSFSTDKQDFKPKKPLSGYQLFVKENFKKIQAENPQIGCIMLDELNIKSLIFLIFNL